ncbi:MAG: hypothetical protein P1U69_13820 [Parvibaculaceae bacterium]|nr:hypothetical protein [Parvibaculaceae bacterium]|tara:strand:+ start:4023 stop:4466 length:444 start_codon:yes stop_codon:yes gene_type:complete
MLKKIMITLGSIVALLAVGFGSLVFYEMQKAPKTTGEATLFAYCKQFGPAKTLSDCQCVLEGARGKLSEDDMRVAWRAQADVDFERWVDEETDKLAAIFSEKNGRLPSHDERRAMRYGEARQSFNAEYKRLKPIINDIVSDCGFGTE